MRVHIKNIDVWSAAKVGCGMAALPMLCVLTVFVLSLADPKIASQLRLPLLFPLGILLYALAVGIIPAIGWALFAILYNVVAIFTGGITVSLKRESVDMPERQQEADAVPNNSVQAWKDVRASEPPPMTHRPTPNPKYTSQPGAGLSTWYDLTQEERELIRKRRG